VAPIASIQEDEAISADIIPPLITVDAVDDAMQVDCLSAEGDAKATHPVN